MYTLAIRDGEGIRTRAGNRSPAVAEVLWDLLSRARRKRFW
jgi:hypothetical protein